MARAKGLLPQSTRGLEIDYAMTFDEMARRIGSSKKATFQTYVRAMRKLAARPRAFDELRELIAYRNKVRDSRSYGVLNVED
jgi:hypothetical protein